MSDAKSPITVTELIQLTKLGIPLQNVTWSRVTMTSDVHICIRYEQQEGVNRNAVKGQLMLVTMKEDGFSHKKWPMSPESAKLSPYPCVNGNQPFIAIKTGDMLMVLQLERSMDIVAKCRMPEIAYWTWLNASTLALITEKNVYHWNVAKSVIPERVFSRHQRLTFAEIINYTADLSLNWLAITGLLPQEDNISGVTQLYCVDSGLTQCISAHTVAFFPYTFEGNLWPSTVLAVASRDSTSHTQGKVHVIELGPHKEGNLAPVSYHDQIKFQDSESRYDFPVAIQISNVYCLMYVMTKYGYVYVCEAESATCLYSTCISSSIVFTSVLSTASQGIITICRSGKVLHIKVKLEELAQHVRHVSRKPVLAQRLEHIATRLKAGHNTPLSSSAAPT